MEDGTVARIGVVTVSDRASQGIYEDRGGPAIRNYLNEVLTSPWEEHSRLVPDDRIGLQETLMELADATGCCLIITTGGTGPAPRDVTPEATEGVCEKLLPGFGELMRQVSLQKVPTAILSRQTAGIRGGSLIINLPGQPKSIQETLEGLRGSSGESVVAGIFAAVPYCIDLIGGPYLETDAAVCQAFRPKTALRPSPATPPSA